MFCLQLLQYKISNVKELENRNRDDAKFKKKNIGSNDEWNIVRVSEQKRGIKIEGKKGEESKNN